MDVPIFGQVIRFETEYSDILGVQLLAYKLLNFYNKSLLFEKEGFYL